jgi:2-methylcitrate dehydratase PrpD
MPGPTEGLSRYVSSIRFEDLPPEVVEMAKNVVIDTLGVAIGGTVIGSFRSVNALTRASGGGASSILRSQMKASPEWAGFANSVAAHALDFDDWHGAGGVHPGVTVIPAALAVAEERGAGGADFLAAVVAGYEAVIRVGILCGRNGFKLGFQPTATCGVFGAMVAAASLYGLDEEAVERGFGIATSLSSGVNCYMHSGGAWVKHLQVGWSVHSGVVAAKLAADGYAAPRGALEGDEGFCFAYGQRKCNLEEFNSSLSGFEILQVQPKAYPCCSDLFSAIEAVGSLIRDNKVSPETIESIRVRGTKIATENCGKPLDMKAAPASTSDARFSLPFVISLVITEGTVDLQNISEDALQDKERIAIAKKVQSTLDDELERMFPTVSAAIVELVTRRGTFTRRVDYPKGTPENPMSREERISKLRECMKFGGLSNTEEIVSSLLNLEKLEKITGLTGLLTWPVDSDSILNKR